MIKRFAFTIATVGILSACATDMESATEGDPIGTAPEAEQVTEASSALTLGISYPADPTRNWYAVVKDQLYIDLTHVRIHNNGGPGKETCEASVCATFDATTNCGTAGPSSVRDATNITFGSDIVLQVERRQGACFTLNFEAKSTSGLVNKATASTSYCWDAGSREWRQNGSGPGINRDESIYKKGNGEFDVSWNWHINWEYTQISGRLEPRLSSSDESADGAQWHHLPVIPKSWSAGATSLTAELDAIGGDPDLYAAGVLQPDSFTFDCRPYHSGTADEFCQIALTDQGGPYFSVRNYRSDTYANYGLLVKPLR